ncbi:hypothetical protein [Noviherbaspirillum massiliense]|uniref:hypothetical protein n=1 Tax=Noviherbaspirillum massiliense TaxID=1465823 RepID=UPI0002DAAB00|nr:hypothetical protein [Noviherbaspirillum massiliense]
MEDVKKDGMRFFIEDGQLIAQALHGDQPLAIASDVLRILDVTHTAASDNFYTVRFERLNGEIAVEDVLATAI